MTYKQAAAKAWQEYRSGRKVSGVKRRKKVSGVKRRKARRVSGATSPHTDRLDKKSVNISIGSVSHHLSQARQRAKEQLGHLLLRRELATGRAKKKISREIAKKKAQIKRLY